MSRSSCSVCHATYAGGERFCPRDGGAIVDDTTDDPLIGKTIDGRYLVRRLIGRGGMGAVYEADHIGLDKRVAIKFVIEVGKDALARFRREARAASRITDDHVVQIFDVGTAADGREYLVMEYLDGRDLRTVLQPGPLPLPRALAIATQILHGLHAIHEAGIVHRDIKPGNILLVGDRDDIKIMDFGISILDVDRGDRVTQSGQVVGTPQFMAPEQLMGQPVDRRADLYAVGITLHAMLTGDVPFTGTSIAEIAAQQLHGPPPALDAERIPMHVVRAVERALARSPEDRFATALELADALGMAAPDPERSAATVTDRPASKRAVPTSVERPRAAEVAPSSSKRLAWLAAGAVVVIAAVVLAIVRFGSHHDPAVAPRDATIAVEDPLAGARAAEHDGNLELAIARYLERYEAAHDPELLYRIGELYERLDRAPDAVIYFQRYLDRDPAAKDRPAVAARIARLAPPQPVDAGTPSQGPSADAGTRATRTTTAIDPTCRCFDDNPSERGSWLCAAKLAPICYCASSDNEALCPTPFVACPEPCPSYSAMMNEGKWLCSVPNFGSPYLKARAGAACAGYPTRDVPASPGVPYHPVERPGTYTCNFCRGSVELTEEQLQSHFLIAGKDGDPCRGFNPMSGSPSTGHVKCGVRP